MSASFVTVSVLLLFLLLILPLIDYLRVRLPERRNEILASFDDRAIELYFRQYQPGTVHERLNNQVTTLRQAFVQYYETQFGLSHFIIPTVLLAFVTASVLAWSALSVCDWLGGHSTQAGNLPELAVTAIMGAYMYVLYDLIFRWNSGSLCPSDILWLSFRIVIAVPMGYALCGALKTGPGVAVAFMLGAFPTNTLFTILRRVAAKGLDQGSIPEGGDNELLKLHGVDMRVAERLARQDITTPLGLAYADPVKLSIHTNLAFTFLTDCASQALLYFYVPDKFDEFRKTTLRSSYEVRSLLLGLEDDDATVKQAAEERFKAIAEQLQYRPEILRNLVEEAGDDPYAAFLYEIFYVAEEDGEDESEDLVSAILRWHYKFS